MSPTRPKRPCNKPSCGALTDSRFCDTHRKEYEQQRGSAHSRGYGARWQQIRAAVLRRDPLCTSCMVEPSTDVDHLVSKAKGGSDDPSNLRGMCHRCHSKRTVMDDGGFGRPRSRQHA